MSTAEAAEVLGVNPSHVRRLAERHAAREASLAVGDTLPVGPETTLPAERTSAGWRFRRGDVEAFAATYLIHGEKQTKICIGLDRFAVRDPCRSPRPRWYSGRRGKPGAGGADLVAGIRDGVTLLHRRSGGDALVEHGPAEEGAEVFDGGGQVQHPGGHGVARGGAVKGGGGLGWPGPVKVDGQAGATAS